MLPILLSLNHADPRNVCFVAHYAQDSITESTILVVLARVSRDIRENPRDFVKYSNHLTLAFHVAMDRGFIALALPFSLFVERSIVELRCFQYDGSKIDHCVDQYRVALEAMLRIRSDDDDESNGRSRVVSDIVKSVRASFAGSLTLRSLKRVIDLHGLTYVLRSYNDMSFPTEHLDLIHSYFHTVVWEILLWDVNVTW